jgi:hypothetical protein
MTLLALLVLTFEGLGSQQPTLGPPLWKDHDSHPISKPQKREASELYAIAHNSFFRHLNLVRKLREGTALNVNAWDEVPNCSWFTNRIGSQPMSFKTILEGLEGVRPNPGKWRIVRINDVGYTPKFDIVDELENRYVLKFDLPSAIERNSAAERICTLIMHAAGYNVPHNSIVYFCPEDLFLDEDSYYKDAIGNRRPMTQKDLEEALQKLKVSPDGRYRGLASFFLPGEDVGKFFYTGRRQDDPNDLIPHEFRRELRGLKVIASWINHVDVKDTNAMDVFISDGEGKGYVKHYFIDFGSTMGSGDFINGPFRVGHEYIYDGAAVGKSFVTLGIWERPWNAKGEILFQEIGYFEAELFRPEKWKPNYPNLAFLTMDDADAYWGAKIVTAFSDKLIHEVVESGRYTNPDVRHCVKEILRKRRDAIGMYWFRKITPLEDFSLRAKGNSYEVSFRNLALERGYSESDECVYRFWAQDRKGLTVVPVKQSKGPSLLVPVNLQPNLLAESSADRWGRIPWITLFVQMKTPSMGWASPVAVVLGTRESESLLSVLGWSHAQKVKP